VIILFVIDFSRWQYESSLAAERKNKSLFKSETLFKQRAASEGNSKEMGKIW